MSWSISDVKIIFLCILLTFHVQCYKIPGESGTLVNNPVTVCYVSTWAVYRPDQGKFEIGNLDPSLCTHLVYAFAGLNVSTSSIKSLDPYNDLEEDYGKGMYKKMTSLKNSYPHLKISVAIGGWNEESAKYSALAASPSKRKTFIESVVEFLKKHNFDGLDLDWEYPAKRGGVPEDKRNFVLLVKELRTEMDKYGWILTAALGAGKDTIDVAYDLPALSKYLDMIHLMCYDYHGAWDSRVGANAPLTSADKNDFLTVEFSIKYLLENGVSSKKVALGLPFYGRTFILQNPIADKNKTTDKGFRGPYTREDGFLGYNEICMEFKENSSSWEQWWDEETKTAFARNNERVIAYDNARSLKEKVKLAARYKLAGVMIWSIDTDDFNGNCKEGERMTYPLLRLIKQALTDLEHDFTSPIDNNGKNINVDDDKQNTIDTDSEKTPVDPNTSSSETKLSKSAITLLILSIIYNLSHKYL